MDPRARIELRELLRALADQGKAVLISSHILTELAEICDTCAIIEQGKLLATGKVADLLAQSQAGAGTELTLRLAAGAEAEAVYDARRAAGAGAAPGGAGVARARAAAGAAGAGAGRDADAGGRGGGAAAGGAGDGAGVPVCAFSHRELNLEDAFMTVTKGRVA